MYSTNLISSSAVIARIKSDLQNPPNRIEGSFAADNAQAVGKEISRYYIYVDWLQRMHYVETAIGTYLDRKAIEAGVFRKEPVRSTGAATFSGSVGAVIPIGLIVRSDTQTYLTMQDGVIGADGTATVDVEAVNPGALGNIPVGAIKGSEPVDGVDSVANAEPIGGGTDREDDETLRDRALLKMRYPGTSGNKYHYIHWALEVDGVGQVKVFPLWDGPGTVKVSVLDANQRAATAELIANVTEHIDGDGGPDGGALAPIGATLTVSTATEQAVNVTAAIQLMDGYEVSGIEEALKVVLQNYLTNLAYVGHRLTVARVIDMLMEIEGVHDINSLQLNGSGDAVIAGEEEILTLGSVVIAI